MAKLGAGGEAPVGPDIEDRARELLLMRRELLDELVQRYSRYSGQLVELETVSGNFQTEVEEVQGFLYAQLLWVRSVPKPRIPRRADLWDSLRWLTAPQNLALDEALLDEAEAAGRPSEVLRLWESPQLVAVVGRSSRVSEGRSEGTSALVGCRGDTRPSIT